MKRTPAAVTAASAVAAVLFLGTSAVAFAADKPKAPFEVVVTTLEGAPVEDADVAITSASTVTPFSFTAKTDAAGKCTGQLVEFKGVYSFKVVKSGYKEFAQDVDFATTKFKKGEVATIKVTLPAITAGEYYNVGATALKAKDLTRAAAQLELAIAADPKMTQAYSVLALIELEQSQWAKALAHADQALALDPNDLHAVRSRYEALTGLGDKPGADAALTALAAKDRSPEVAKLLYNAGALAGNAKEVDRRPRSLQRSAGDRSDPPPGPQRARRARHQGEEVPRGGRRARQGDRRRAAQLQGLRAQDRGAEGDG